MLWTHHQPCGFSMTNTVDTFSETFLLRALRYREKRRSASQISLRAQQSPESTELCRWCVFRSGDVAVMQTDLGPQLDSAAGASFHFLLIFLWNRARKTTNLFWKRTPSLWTGKQLLVVPLGRWMKMARWTSNRYVSSCSTSGFAMRLVISDWSFSLVEEKRFFEISWTLFKLGVYLDRETPNGPMGSFVSG